MPSTYSINNNTIYESHRVSSVTDALYLLPDNTSKLISPRDVRDAVFSAWESSVFKQTTGSHSIEYIGLDRDIKQKMYFGKKKVGGLDILNNTLLNYNLNDTDIFFYNNKNSLTPSNTKISFLAGTESYLYQVAPYFNAYSTTNSTINLDIVNQTGDIILDSHSGRISINNVIFPTKLQTASASNGQILKYYNGALVWEDNTINLANIGDTSSVTNILGNPVQINGNDMELTDVNPIIATFGHIYTGQTFSKAPIVEVVRRMLYPYLPPTCELMVNIGNGFTYSQVAEKGSITSSAYVNIRWTITKKSDSVVNGTAIGINGYSFTPITTPGLTLSTGIASGNLHPTGAFNSSDSPYNQKYTLTIQDTGNTNRSLSTTMSYVGVANPSTITASASIDFVFPFFYGMSNYNANTTNGSIDMTFVLPSLNKYVDKLFVNGTSSKSFMISGTNSYIYFCIPALSGYANISQILDNNGFDITSSFVEVKQNVGIPPFISLINATISSPSGFWSNKPYYIYKFGPTTVPVSASPWTLKFNI
jgi:hypothetical protein